MRNDHHTPSSSVDQLPLARYQGREENWVFARDQLPAAYRAFFRSTVRFGDSIVDPQLRVPRGSVILHDLLRAGKIDDACFAIGAAYSRDTCHASTREQRDKRRIYPDIPVVLYSLRISCETSRYRNWSDGEFSCRGQRVRCAAHRVTCRMCIHTRR